MNTYHHWDTSYQYKISESLKLIRLNSKLSLDNLVFKTKVGRKELSLLERGKLNISLHYCEKIYSSYGFTTYISNETIEIFQKWKNETLLSMIIFDGKARNLFDNCPVDLYIIEHSPLYIDYKILYFILYDDEMSIQEVDNIKKSVLEEDELNYFLFKLFYASYLYSHRKFEKSYNHYRKIKPIYTPNYLAMYYYIGSFILDRFFHLEESLELLDEAKKMFKELGYKQRYYFCVMAKGITLMKLNRYDESTKAYFETLNYFKDNGLINVEYSTVCNIEWNYLLQGKYEEAWETIKLFPEDIDKDSFYYFIQVICLYKEQNYDECSKYIDLCIEHQDRESFNKRYCDLISQAIRYGENYRYEKQSIMIFEKLLDHCEYSNARFVALQLYEHYSKKQNLEQMEKWYRIYKSDNIKVDGLKI